LRRLDLTIYISGCPNACGQHPIANIGLQSIQLKTGGELRPGYNIYLGGRLGPRLSFGRLVKQRVEADQVRFLIENIIKAYLHGRKGLETFSDYCERNSVEVLEAIMDRSSGVPEKGLEGSLEPRRDALRL